MKKSVFIVLLLAVCSFATAETAPLSLVLPKNTSLKLKKLETEPHTASFTGQTWIAGIFVAQWVGVPQDVNDKNYASLEYVIVPDSKSMTKLPYFSRYQPQVIYLINDKAALQIVAGKEKASRLLKHKINKVRILGKFLIGSYRVGIECDTPWADAKLISFEVPDHIAGLHEIPEDC